MYIANRRDSSKFNGCSPLQLHLGLIGLKPAIAYLPYTYRNTFMKKTLLTIIITFSIFSCKKEINYDDDSELCKLLSEMFENDQRIRKMELLYNGTEKEKDSLWEIQSQIDIKNTELLIEITEKRGWVSKSELGCERQIAPVVIFRHSPEKYFTTIKKLIDKEREARRMNSGDHMFIDNHLKGRPDFEFQTVD